MPRHAVKTDHYTYADYCRWPEDERWELIDGVAYSMSPAPSVTHQSLLGELHLQIAGFLRGKPCRVFVAPFDVRLPRNNENDEQVDTVVQPDLTVICDPEKLDKAGCRGAPDWLIEILSPSTAAKDQSLKRALYEKHGVREYWLAHPEDRTVAVYRLAQGAYGKPHIQELRGKTPSAVLAGLEIDWDLWRG